MPSTSSRQQRFMGAELGRLRAGKKTKTGMSEQQLEEFASAVDTTKVAREFQKKTKVRGLGR